MKREYHRPQVDYTETEGFIITESVDLYSPSDNDGPWQEKWNEIFGQ